MNCNYEVVAELHLMQALADSNSAGKRVASFNISEHAGICISIQVGPGLQILDTSKSSGEVS